MLQLRWLKGKWGFGKFKLQYREIGDETKISSLPFKYDWKDIPVFDNNPKVKSLEDKFFEAGCFQSDDKSVSRDFCKKMAEVASKHYEELKWPQLGRVGDAVTM